jgi:predicted PurR-regulated permease PerM
VIVLAGMKAASPILGPLLFSVFLAVIFGMLLHWLGERGLSPRSALLLTLAIFIAVIAVFLVVIAGSFFSLLSDLPLYREELERSLEIAGPILSPYGINSFSLSDLPAALPELAGGVAAGLLDLALTGALIVLTTVFLICEAGGFSKKLQQIIGELRPGDLHRFNRLARENIDYLIIRTGVNLAMGIGTAIILWLIGVEYAILWGFLAFLLGFIPYIGFWLAVIPPMLLAWFELGPVVALLVLAGEAVINLLTEYVMFPHLAGRGLSLSPVVVLISLIFWGWLLGGFGVLLAVPLTLTVRMICELSDSTRWIGFLIGPAPDLNEQKRS